MKNIKIGLSYLASRDNYYPFSYIEDRLKEGFGVEDTIGFLKNIGFLNSFGLPTKSSLKKDFIRIAPMKHDEIDHFNYGVAIFFTGAGLLSILGKIEDYIEQSSIR